ncbi:MAG TPA: tetratricopeptide repeat protein, partial [Brevundimonas sp.]|nr:tetratricopeptide repeat protein [Brevundimonas sp.]
AGQGRLDVAEAMMRRALAAMPVTTDPGSLGGAYSGLADVLIARGDYAGAGDVVDLSLALSRETFGEDHPETAAALFSRAKVHMMQGRPADAAPLLEQSSAIFRDRLPQRPGVQVRPLLELAQAEELTGRRDAARTHLIEARGVAAAELPDGHPTRTLAVAQLGSALEGWGQTREALPVLREAGEALKDRARRGGSDAGAREDFGRLRGLFRQTVSAAWAEAH